MLRRHILLPLVLALVAAGCSSSGNQGADDGDLIECSDTYTEVTVTGDPGSAPDIEVPDAEPPCELQTVDLSAGDGTEATAGATLSMQYKGVSWSTGEQFDASWDRGEPFEFELGAGMVIQGWDQGILGMKVGGRRLLVIPPDLGYGETGQGEIAPNETLVFVVDLEVTPPPPPPACVEGKGPKVDVSGELGSKPKFAIPDGDPACELQTIDVVVGDGAEAKAGSTLSMQYVGKSWSTKQEFDASWDRGQAFEFELGAGRVIQGWDKGIEGMKVGGRRVLIIPPDLGYGARGAGGAIGPNETLVFVVDLEAVN
jgi:peptidylprolyl isomerase